MKQVKRYIAILLALLMVISVMPMTVLADVEEPSDNNYDYDYSDTISYELEEAVSSFAAGKSTSTLAATDDTASNALKGSWNNGTWSISGTTLTISGTGDMTTNEITDNNGRQTTFGQLVLDKSIKTIKIGDGITSLADYFLYIDENTMIRSLVNVGLPNKGITKIGKYAFANTTVSSIFSLFVTNLLTSFGSAFATLKDFSHLCPDIEEIGEYAFANTPNLRVSIILPVYLKAVPEGCFYNSAVVGVEMFGYVESIGKRAFSECQSLGTIEIPFTADIYEDEENPGNNAFGIDSLGNLYPSTVVHTRDYGNAYEYAQKYGIPTEYQLGIAVGNGTIQVCRSTGVSYSDVTYLKNINGWYKANWNYFAEDKTAVISPNYYDDKGSYEAQCKRFVAASSKQEVDCSFTTTNFYLDSVNVTKTIKPGDMEVDRVIVEDLTKIKACGVFSLFNPKYVELPDSLTELDYYVFKDCKRLKSVNIPDSVVVLGGKTFQNNSSLEGVNLGNGITEIPDQLFYNCKQLKFVQIGTAVQSIGEKAFQNCVGLQEIVIPDNVKTIAANAFNNCIGVQEIVIGKGVTAVGDGAFSNLIYCERAYINANLPYVEPVEEDEFYKQIACFSALGDYTTGTELILGSNVTKFIHNGFDINDNNVALIKINSNLQTSSDIFNQFPELRRIMVAGNCTRYYTYDDCLYNSSNNLVAVPRAKGDFSIKPDCIGINDYACAMTTAKSVDVPSSVTSIGAYAFADSATLKKISFNGTALASIGEGAFRNCTKLKTFNSPFRITQINASTFEGCTNLASVILSESLTYICDNAFRNCSSLKTVVIPEITLRMGEYAFADCENLEEAYIWSTDFTNSTFDNCPLLHIYTMAGTRAYEYARANRIEYSAYTDEDCFFDECAVKLDILAGYLGMCADGHGDIEWLTIYEADCDNDGYKIGVCEYCSEILEEEHLNAEGHSYSLATEIPATESTRGMKIFTCSSCNGSYTEYTAPLSEDYVVETHTVSGMVVISTNREATAGKSPAKNCNILIDNMIVATTDSDGNFSFDLETGSYVALIKYAFGFERSVYIIVEDEDIVIEEPIAVIGCDFNRDGVIDDNDLQLFQMVISAQEDDPSYLSYVDMNNDGYINVKDRVYITTCKGLEATKYQYPTLVATK